MTQVGAPVDITQLQPDPDRRPLGPVAAKPLVGVAIAMIVGIAIYARLPQVPLLFSLLAIVLAGAGILLRSRPALITPMLWLGTACLGAAMGQLSAWAYPTNHIALFTTETRRLAQVELQVIHPPRIYAPTFGQAHPMPPRQVLLARVSGVRTWDGWQTSSGDILVQISEPDPRLRVGQTIRAWGMLDRPAPAMNPGQFDWAAYYRMQRVLASLHIPRASNIVIVQDDGPSLLARWRAWTRDTLASGFTDRQSLDHALLSALVLGDSDPELRDVQEQFRATGTSHHLAISGMHIAVMGGVIFLMARVLRISPGKSWMIAMVFVTLYGLAALPSPPVVRSVLLWLALGVAILARRATDLLQLLSLVVIGMLLYHPLDLFNAGFQLSFGIVLGLILLTRPMTHILGMNQRDELEVATEPTRWALRAAAYVDNQILLIIAAGIVAYLVSIPVIASHFTQLNPYAIAASILLAPVVFVTLIAGVFKIMLTALFPGFAGTFAWIAQQPTAGMRVSVDWLSRIPGGDVPLPAPTWWMIGLFYMTLILAAVAWRARSARILTRLAHLASIGVLLILPYHSTITQASPVTTSNGLRLTLLSVGAGQCAVIEPPSGRVTVIDAGSLSLSDPVRRAIAPFLRQRGITMLDTIAVSHANSDHFSAVGELVEAYGVRQVIVGHNFHSSGADNPMLAETLSQLKRNQTPPTVVSPGQIIPLGSDTTLEVIWPASDASSLAANDQSMVVRLTHAGTRVLFAADIQDDAVRELMTRAPDAIRSDILVAPHHGSAEDTTSAFLNAVGARTILASNDRTLTGKQNHFDQLMRSRTLLRTHTSGAITLTIDDKGVYHVEPHLRGD